VKNETILRAIGGIDDELIERAADVTLTRVKRAAWVKRAAIAACFVIAVTAALPSILKNPTPVRPGSAITPPDATGEAPTPNGAVEYPRPESVGDVTGLPSGDYTWDEGVGVSSDRILMSELRLLMREFSSDDRGVSAAFAIVRPISAESFTDARAGQLANEGQIAECEVLFSIGDEVGKSLRVKQYLYGGCTGEEQTNLLRVGGAYVLPLVTEQYEDVWWVYGDLDVLFEVDENGRVHSHARADTLKKYDGESVTKLWEDIEYLENNPLLRSHLAENIAYGMEVQFDGDTAKLIYPPTGWNPEDTQGFSAEFDKEGKLNTANRKNEANFNVFEIVEGMTKEEVVAALQEIKAFLAVDGRQLTIDS
jgi:hypothetical protein